MKLTWNTIRARAAKFAQEWDGAGYERGQTQLFYQDFFRIFGMNVRRFAQFEFHVKKPGNHSGYIDLFWKGMLLVEQKSKGRSLEEAKTQALEYFPGLNDDDLPRFILLSDFQNFELHDTEYPENDISFPLSDLRLHVERFGFIIGIQKIKFRDQDPVNIKASELVGKLYDSLVEDGYNGHDLERFLVRLVFCLFSQSTGIFESLHSFTNYLENHTLEDGSDLGIRLTKIFEVLNTPEERRSSRLDEDLTKFPYIDGDLFADNITRIPDFDTDMRNRLLDVCRFNWSKISPAIFGSLFQSVMDKKKRRATGAHYTTEKNIMKVIEPLFLNDLRAEFKRITSLKNKSARRKQLLAFQGKLSNLTFFDPACGSGNFLIIAYREIRELEIDLLFEIHAKDLERLKDGATQMRVRSLTKIDVDQFYGLEIGEFAARIAETAMWMMDHLMNIKMSEIFGLAFARIPLQKSPHIHAKDALDEDWEKILPADRCSYILGNPPFLGAKLQTPKQREQVRQIAKLGGSGGTLDYVSAWFIRAAEYSNKGGAKIGLVATNSITQGDQVAQLWPILFDKHKLEIAFAHRTFAWGSDARGKAHVHVIILGLYPAQQTPKRRILFTYEDINGDPSVNPQKNISPYLVDAQGLSNPHAVVFSSSSPLNGLPNLTIGSKPVDGNYFILDRDEKDDLLTNEPSATPYIHPFVDGDDFVHGRERWIIDINDVSPQDIRNIPKIREIVKLVRSWRSGEIPAKGSNNGRITKPTGSARALADRPTQYHVYRRPSEPFLTIPETTTRRRKYIPIGWLNPPVIPSNTVRFILEADHALFGLLTSAMHMSWLNRVGGRFASSYRYSIKLVYNTYPLPDRDFRTTRIANLAKAILDERKNHPDAALSDLYDPDFMPSDLLRAHKSLDRAIDRLYRKAPFENDEERADFLLNLYESRRRPLMVKRAPRRRRK